MFANVQVGNVSAEASQGPHFQMTWEKIILEALLATLRSVSVLPCSESAILFKKVIVSLYRVVEEEEEQGREINVRVQDLISDVFRDFLAHFHLSPPVQILLLCQLLQVVFLRCCGVLSL